MTAKAKAKELVEKYYYLCESPSAAIKYALIAVDEILNLDYFSEEGRQYWQEVKKEIELL